MMNQLNLGDKIYQIKNDKIIRIHIVDFVTKTKVRANSIHFYSHYTTSITTVENSMQLGDDKFYIESPELIEMYYKQKLVGIINAFPLKKLPIDKLTQIVDILN